MLIDPKPVSREEMTEGREPYVNHSVSRRNRSCTTQKQQQ
jgi:hypothetical protein